MPACVPSPASTTYYQMIVVPEQSSEKSASRTRDEAPAHEQPPPSYDESTNAAGDSAPTQPSSSSLPKPTPTNYVSVSKRHGEVIGSWVIDPRIQGTPAFLDHRATRGDRRDLRGGHRATWTDRREIRGGHRAARGDHRAVMGEHDGPRRNLHVTVHNGALSLDITIVPSESVGSSSGRTAALLEAHTVHGAVKFNLHDAPGEDGLVRLPVKVTVTSHNGAIYVRLPRSFRGVINAGHSWGSVQLSDDVSKQVRYSKEEEWTKRIFVGDFDESDFSLTTWAGDEINAQTRRGNVCFAFEDEAEVEAESTASLFGGFCLLSKLKDVVMSRVAAGPGALPRR